MVQNSPYGAGATEAAIAAANAAIAELKAGKPIFRTAITDNKGKIVLANAPKDNYADPLNNMDYLVDGVHRLDALMRRMPFSPGGEGPGRSPDR